MAQTLQAIMDGLNSSGYDTQRAAINSQIAALPGQQAADQAGLDQAKTNAFGDITSQANSRGMVYSGAPIQEQSRYVGEKYLPAVANLKNTYANNTSRLQSALGSLNANEYKQANDTLANEQRAEADAAAKAQSTQMAEERLALQAQRINASGSSGAMKGYGVTIDKSGGHQFHGPNGQPLTAAQYYDANGEGQAGLMKFLSADPNSKAAYTDMKNGVHTDVLAQKYPWIFGG